MNFYYNKCNIYFVLLFIRFSLIVHMRSAKDQKHEAHYRGPFILGGKYCQPREGI
jgi:hypothetical protein